MHSGGSSTGRPAVLTARDDCGVRLVATDLDGTIVDRTGSITPRTVQALAACEAAGVGVVFVTGRPVRWMVGVAEATGHHGVAVCANGAVVYDLARESILETRALAPARVLEIADRLRAALPDAVFALETLAGHRREPAFMPHHEATRTAPTGSLTELLAVDPIVIKILCRVERAESGGRHVQHMLADELLAVARRVLAGIAEPVHSDPHGGLLEIAAAGVSKASTLELFAARRGIEARDVVAFGDMPNDVPMLRWAGRSYAMADGHPEAVAAADDVAPPCEQDGVAQVLERLLSELL